MAVNITYYSDANKDNTSSWTTNELLLVDNAFSTVAEDKRLTYRNNKWRYNYMRNTDGTRVRGNALFVKLDFSNENTSLIGDVGVYYSSADIIPQGKRM
jgi:hypothetical protein